MSTTEAQQLIGKRGEWTPPKSTLIVEIEILDARNSFGRTDLQITPVSGRNLQWVNSNSVTIESVKP